MSRRGLSERLVHAANELARVLEASWVAFSMSAVSSTIFDDAIISETASHVDIDNPTPPDSTLASQNHGADLR